jgi:signal transduction histidine kinase
VDADEQIASVAPIELERLQAEIAELREAVRARDIFMSIAAHELRNPMAPLVGRISLLQVQVDRAGGSVPPKVAQGIRQLDVILRRYVRRTITLLDISRLTSGRFTLDPAEIDVSTVIARLVEDFAPHAEQAGSAITATIDPGIVGLFDVTAIEEIAENLISNAVKYGEGKPIDVVLARAPGAIRLEVRDRGPGISAADRGRIFERFERLAGSRPTTGFGLGLWVVGQLTDAMGGTIAVEGTDGEGTVFTVRVPLRTASEGT